MSFSTTANAALISILTIFAFTKALAPPPPDSARALIASVAAVEAMIAAGLTRRRLRLASAWAALWLSFAFTIYAAVSSILDIDQPCGCFGTYQPSPEVRLGICAILAALSYAVIKTHPVPAETMEERPSRALGGDGC